MQAKGSETKGPASTIGRPFGAQCRGSWGRTASGARAEFPTRKRSGYYCSCLVVLWAQGCVVAGLRFGRLGALEPLVQCPQS